MSKVGEKDIILFDGVCNLCNGAVDFIIKRDAKGRFKLGALQSPKVQIFLDELDIGKGLDSIILIRGKKIFNKSTAALEIAKHLQGFWPLLYLFIIVPTVIRHPVYDFIARNRYKWFGKVEACRLPTQNEASRFF